MKEIRLATIGSGTIVHSILDAIEKTDNVKCVAVYSRIEKKGRELAGKYHVKKVYTDLDSMFRDEEINFIYIASPNSLHYEQTKRALLAGRNVICEKPFCTREKQAREIVALAKEKKLFLIDAVPTTFLPNFEILKRELPKVGKIKLVLSNYSRYSSRYDQILEGKLPNVFNPEFAGGCLMDINFYNIYLNISLFGKPETIRYYPNIFKNLTDTSGIVILRYQDFVSECAGAKDTWGVNAVQIQGEKGYIYINGGSNGLAEIRVVTKDTDKTFNNQDIPDRWFYEIQRITQLILADDYKAVYDRLDIMVDVVSVLETARTEAGIVFPGD